MGTRQGPTVRAFEPAASHPAGPPSADPESTAGSRASAVPPGQSPVGGSSSVDGGGGEPERARGAEPLRGGEGATPPPGAPGAPPSLDTNAITRPARERCAETGCTWLRQLGAVTEVHRRARAEAHLKRSRPRCGGPASVVSPSPALRSAGAGTGTGRRLSSNASSGCSNAERPCSRPVARPARRSTRSPAGCAARGSSGSCTPARLSDLDFHHDEAVAGRRRRGNMSSAPTTHGRG